MSESSRPAEATAKRKTVDDDSTDSNAILERLFPGLSSQDLSNLSREQLIERLPYRPPASPHADNEDGDRDSQEDARSLEQLQDFPESRTAATSRPQSPSASNGVTDDINALALAPKKARSYLGVSSVVAVLRIILLLDPDSKAFTSSAAAGHNAARSGPDRDTAQGPKEPQQPPASPAEPEQLPTMWDEVPAINAYFTYVHPQIPLLDEAEFRECYMSRRRSDVRWKLLLNSVLAMGSVAASTADSKVHSVFYERARQHLGLELFAASHLETVQALVILGGMYLHYAQQPHLANCLVGATFRMATTLGLHRDYSEAGSASRPADFMHVAEIRRRTWWSLCCLDACNSNFLGRPTLGRMGPGHTAKKPESPFDSNSAMTTLLTDTIDYCEISTRMDDYLADHSVLGHSTRQELDKAFLGWLNRPSLSHPDSSGDSHAGITVARNVMRWRCQSARIFIYRPILLWYAMRREPASRISASKREAIQACRAIAAHLIEDISHSWQTLPPCVMAGWHATWLIYQTSMVPMLSLFCDSGYPDVVAASRRQIERVISTLSALENWSCTARRSLEVVTRLYNASQAYHERLQQQQQQQRQVKDGSATLPPDVAEEASRAMQIQSQEAAEGQVQGTPATNFSGSAGEEFLLGEFFDDMSWMDGLHHSVHGVGNDLAFLDYYEM
ncbi:hypothetical protein NLU13_7318 [Sarocladium strictum]|uniref:Xylanolytic transcriptional activator regulatory domain-containing protein n=1 Tax=Sarocladium strictum TaxID=5046 RepID=A0AA39GCL4_SARSR|nr:hypothetical protein NLU13_7318 [Sarocladium strictum]